MLRNCRCFGVLVVLAASAFLGTPALSHAQRGGGAHVGAGAGHAEPFVGGAYRGGYGWHGYGDHRFWGYGGGFYGGYYYDPYFPYYGLDLPPYYGPYPYAVPLYPPPPAPIYLGSAGTTAPPSAVTGAGYTVASPPVQGIVSVTVPPSTRLYVQDTPTSTTGTVREFQTPPLQAGQSYTYRIRAEWEQDGRQMSQTQTINVVGGQNVRIGFPADSTGLGN